MSQKPEEDHGILEKAPNNFTVYFKKRYYGHFTSKEGAVAFLEVLKKDEENKGGSYG